MIRSMTGYGEAGRDTPAGLLSAEVRTVNHRHFHVNFRLPHALARWEGEIRERLRAAITRGAVSCTVRLEPHEGDAAAVGLALNHERVAAYLSLFREMQERHGVPGQADVNTLARLPEVFVRDDDARERVEIALEDVLAVIDEAAAQNVRMREDEGRRLADDLEGRLAAIDGALDAVEARAPERIVAERDRLRAAVQELAGGVGVSDERLAQEIAYLAERWDVNEELVRFRSHNALFRELMRADAAEPVGKRLSFLVQEMHREANTIGSKANDAAIAHRVVAVKDEIERLREQVENVE
jgi:uncharacterized protein (TIGR00255 family)